MTRFKIYRKKYRSTNGRKIKDETKFQKDIEDEIKIQATLLAKPNSKQVDDEKECKKDKDLDSTKGCKCAVALVAKYGRSLAISNILEDGQKGNFHFEDLYGGLVAANEVQFLAAKQNGYDFEDIVLQALLVKIHDVDPWTCRGVIGESLERLDGLAKKSAKQVSPSLLG